MRKHGSRQFCNHYRAMSEHKTCSAGVAYETFQGTEFQPFDKRPCFSDDGQPRLGCDLVQMPTPEEIAAGDAWVKTRWENISKARAAIVADCGGPWKKGVAGAQGQIDCPVCNGVKSLRYTRAGYNGHVHAACGTVDCVSWVE